MTMADIDAVCYAWNATPVRMLHMYLHHPLHIPIWHWPELALAGHRILRDLMSPRKIAKALADKLGCRLPRVRGVAHHVTHAACAYFTSPFNDAAVLTVDGQGEDESVTLGEWHGSRYKRFQSIYSPNSIGILYGLVTDFLGMRAAWDEYKVMAMASYGNPSRFAPQFDDLVRLKPNGKFITRRTALVVKHREQFRPFAGAVPIEVAAQYFDIAGESPYMQFVVPVLPAAQSRIAAVVHKGTCRIQTVSRESDPLFHELLNAFGARTGVPVLLNTSFNDRDEPIVCSPRDAVRTFLNTDLDGAVLGPFIVSKRARALI